MGHTDGGHYSHQRLSSETSIPLSSALTIQRLLECHHRCRHIHRYGRYCCYCWRCHFYRGCHRWRCHYSHRSTCRHSCLYRHRWSHCCAHRGCCSHRFSHCFWRRWRHHFLSPVLLRVVVGITGIVVVAVIVTFIVLCLRCSRCCSPRSSRPCIDQYRRCYSRWFSSSLESLLRLLL